MTGTSRCRWMFVVALIASLLAGASARAQCGDWQRARDDNPGARASAAFAFDAARGRVVMFGGSESRWVWEWDGSRWFGFPPSNLTSQPTPTSGLAMSYDAIRQRCVLFGGDNSDTWEWDGSAWSRRSTQGPAPRTYHSMSYDQARSRIVLFGGSRRIGNTTTYFNDTWEWNGADWIQMADTGPAPRRGQVSAYDPLRGRTVLFGGEAADRTLLSDTWEWNASAWVQTSSNGPIARSEASMTFDSNSQHILLFGGRDGLLSSFFRNDVWAWDGAQWIQLIPGTGPSPRLGSMLAFDSVRSRALLFGGEGRQTVTTNDTWEWNGTSWTQRGPTEPSSRSGHAMAFDSARGRAVLFGGYSYQGSINETWEWDGGTWIRTATAGPSDRFGHAMAYDPIRQCTILFGGRSANNGSARFADTWQWNGTQWQQRNVPGPTARSEHAMAYDAARGRIVLFGGSTAGTLNTPLSDTWEWDGNAWAQIHVSGPAARSGHMMSYDSARQRVVLTGGTAPSYLDTWEWDGHTWTHLPDVMPYVPSRTSGAMAYDPVRGCTILAGGCCVYADLQEWNGAVWSQRLSQSAVQRSNTAMVYDTINSRMILFGGYDGSIDHSDTWILPSEPAPPLILTHPVSQSIRSGDTASFSIVTRGGGPFSYQWLRDWQTPVNDGPGGASFGGGTVSGATTPNLTIAGVQFTDSLPSFRCVVTNSCGSISTQVARLTWLACGSPDFNHDGEPATDADIESFFACLAGSCCTTCGTADFNGDSEFGTDADIESFFRVLAGGTC